LPSVITPYIKKKKKKKEEEEKSLFCVFPAFLQVTLNSEQWKS